jgi:hypothetical protein
MSSMPTPVATAGRGTRRRTDTAWQSVIVVAECLSRGGPVNTPSGQATLPTVQAHLDPLDLPSAAGISTIDHRW